MIHNNDAPLSYVQLKNVNCLVFILSLSQHTAYADSDSPSTESEAEFTGNWERYCCTTKTDAVIGKFGEVSRFPIGPSSGQSFLFKAKLELRPGDRPTRYRLQCFSSCTIPITSAAVLIVFSTYVMESFLLALYLNSDRNSSS